MPTFSDPGEDTDEFMLPSLPTDALQRHSASALVQVDLAARSHPGLVRAGNEDSFLVVRADRALTALATNLPNNAILPRFEEIGYGMLVADGMGGISAGDVASRTAAQTLLGLVLSTPDWIMRIGAAESERVLARIAERYRLVDRALKEDAASDPKLYGMGTTMTVGYSLGADLFLGHVGDSRAYLLRRAGLHRLTRDHTMAQVLADAGVIEPREIVRHRFRHALTRYLGGKEPVKAEVHHTRLQDGDQILLCTDGLTEMLDDAAIAEVLCRMNTADNACRALVDAALERGGKDNVTVALARYQIPQGPQ